MLFPWLKLNERTVSFDLVFCKLSEKDAFVEFQHSDSLQHLLHTNVGDEILPLMSFFHVLALI